MAPLRHADEGGDGVGSSGSARPKFYSCCVDRPIRLREPIYVGEKVCASEGLRCGQQRTWALHPSFAKEHACGTKLDIFAKIENQSKVSFGLRTVPFGKLILEAIVCQRQCLLQAFVRPGRWSVLSEASSASIRAPS